VYVTKTTSNQATASSKAIQHFYHPSCQGEEGRVTALALHRYSYSYSATTTTTARVQSEEAYGRKLNSQNKEKKY
jgi:hypothetical protein